MTIPAFIIDEIQKERARRVPVFEELQIEQEIPAAPTYIEEREEAQKRDTEEIDFFI